MSASNWQYSAPQQYPPNTPANQYSTQAPGGAPMLHQFHPSAPSTPQQIQQPYTNTQVQQPQQLQPYQFPQYQPQPKLEKEKGGFLKALNVFSAKTNHASTVTPMPATYTAGSVASPTMYNSPIPFQSPHGYGSNPGPAHSPASVASAPQLQRPPPQPLQRINTMQQWGQQADSRPLPPPPPPPPPPPCLPPLSARPMPPQQGPMLAQAQQTVAPAVSFSNAPAQPQQPHSIQKPAEPQVMPGSYPRNQSFESSAVQPNEAPPPPYSNPLKPLPPLQPTASSSQRRQSGEEEAILQPSQWPNEKAVPLSSPRPNPIPEAINNLNKSTRSSSIASQVEVKGVDLFWGYLFDDSKSPPEPKPLLSEFVRGVGKYLISAWEKAQNTLISPDSMAMLYATLTERGSTKLDFFVSAQTSSKPIIAIYRALGCQYFLIPRKPPPEIQSGAAHPLVPKRNRELQPGLTLQGFERWMVLQILLHPDREWKRIDRLLKAGNVKILRDDGVSTFPTNIPRGAFPDTPNPEIINRFGKLLSPLRADSPALLELIERDPELGDAGKDQIIEELRKVTEDLRDQIFERDQEIKRLRQHLGSIGRPDSVVPNASSPIGGARVLNKRQSIAFADPVILGIDTPAPTPRPTPLRSTSNPVNRLSIHAPIPTIPESETPPPHPALPPKVPMQQQQQRQQPTPSPHNQRPQSAQHFKPNPLARASTSFPISSTASGSTSGSGNYQPYISQQPVSPTENSHDPNSREKREKEWEVRTARRVSLNINIHNEIPGHEDDAVSTAGSGKDAAKRASMMLVDPSVRQRIERKEAYRAGQNAFARSDEFAKITGGL